MKVTQTGLFQKWFNGLRDKPLQKRITDRIQRIEQDGFFGKTYPIVGSNGISEIKFETGAGYRIYFNVYIQGNEVLFLTGGSKSTQNKDIEIAKKLLQEIKKQKKEQENERNNDYGRRR